MERIKETNVELDKQLKNEEIATAQTGDKIVNTTSEQKNLALDKDYLERDLKDKLGLLENLARQKNQTQQQLDQAVKELEILRQEENHVRADNEHRSDQIVKL